MVHRPYTAQLCSPPHHEQHLPFRHTAHNLCSHGCLEIQAQSLLGQWATVATAQRVTLYWSRRPIVSSTAEPKALLQMGTVLCVVFECCSHKSSDHWSKVCSVATSCHTASRDSVMSSSHHCQTSALPSSKLHGAWLGGVQLCHRTP